MSSWEGKSLDYIALLAWCTQQITCFPYYSKSLPQYFFWPDVHSTLILKIINLPHVFLISLALPSINRDSTSGHGSSSVILGGENVTWGPSNFSSQLQEGLDQTSGLDGHVKTSRNSGSFQRLGSAVLFAQMHQTGHFIFGQSQFFAAKFGQVDVG